MRRSRVDLPAFGRPMPDVGDQLQREAQPVLLAAAARFRRVGSLPRGRREAGIAAPASTAARDDESLLVLDEVAGSLRRRRRIGVAHDQADRQSQHAILAILPKRPLLRGRRPRRAPAGGAASREAS
jgi:hypothetical protein